MTPTPDLYQLYGLDRTNSSDELGLLLSGRDAALENRGMAADAPQRHQLQVAYAVLKAPEVRSVYDHALSVGQPLNWYDLEHLGNFGTLPSYPTTGPQPQAQPQPGPAMGPGPGPWAPTQGPHQPPFQQPPFPQGVPGQGQPFPSPHQQAPTPAYAASHAVVPYSDRPGAGLRLGMMLIDSVAAGLLAAVGGAIFFFSDSLLLLASGLIGVAYFIGFEVYTGATPAKHLFGYEVRDATTGEKLELAQSAKRYWWRLITLIPGIGMLIAVIGMIAIGVSISPANNNIGSHDRWAGAEVVRKQRY